MPLSESILSNNRWSEYSLTFLNSRLEAHYRHYSFPRLLSQARLALLLGAMMYEMYGILDFLLVEKSMLSQVTIIRTVTTCTILAVFGTTFLKVFKRYTQQILTFIFLFSAVGLLWKMALIEQTVFPYYFSGLLLMLFWIHAFYILEFRYAFLCTFSIVCISTIAFISIFNYSHVEIFGYLFILLSVFGVSMFSSYIAEKRDRALFLREKELDRERFVQRERATHDSLTNLPNRVLLMDRINQAILESRRNNQVSAAFFIDLDNFKDINDTYGHATGDIVLIEVASRLKSSIRAVDTVARLAGDEFFVLAQDIKNEELAQIFGGKLLNQIDLPYIIDNEPLSHALSASIGICLFPYPGVTALEVIAKADRAMYEVKLTDKSGIKISQLQD
jgi:diguanylate cyclase (GGDEF)-like protein